MLELQRCRTTTCKETILSDPAVQRKRAQLKKDVSSFTSDHAYRTLLQGDSFVEMDQSEAAFAVPMKRSMLGLYLVPIIINGNTYRFVVDTGAQISSVKSSLIADLHLDKLPGSLSIGSVGGKEIPLAGYLMKELHLGSVCIHNLPVIEVPMKDLSVHFSGLDISPFDGILGWDILSCLDFELDDVGKQFKVKHNCYHFCYPNMVRAAFPIFLVKDHKGNLLTLGFDSGARYGWMGETAMKHFGYEMSDETDAMGFGVHGLEEMRIRSVYEMKLYLDRAEIQLRRIHTGRTNIFSGWELDGILGNEIFRNRRIRMINSKEMVLLV